MILFLSIVMDMGLILWVYVYLSLSGPLCVCADGQVHVLVAADDVFYEGDGVDLIVQGHEQSDSVEVVVVHNCADELVCDRCALSVDVLDVLTAMFQVLLSQSVLHQCHSGVAWLL